MEKEIALKGLLIDGKHQKEWFKIFDLLDKIYSVEKRNDANMVGMSFDGCTIKNFNIQMKDMKEGTTRRMFAELIITNGNRSKNNIS